MSNAFSGIFLIAEVIITFAISGWESLSAIAWSESTPMANFLDWTAASRTPSPDCPAAVNTTEIPELYIKSPFSFPFAVSVKLPT